MLTAVDLRKLTELTAPDRCFLSLYLERPDSLDRLEPVIRKMENSLPADAAGTDERRHLEENLAMVRKELDTLKPVGSSAVFACWLLDFVRVIQLPVPVRNRVIIDASPFIRPLAEILDEYENAAVVVADNKKARIFMVSSTVAGDESVIRGNIKNHVRKGGWSQQRYERRRDKQLLHYARDIIDALQVMDQEEDIRHILLVGGKEIFQEIYRDMPPALQEKTVTRRADLGQSSDALEADIQDLLRERERESEHELWERIRSEFLRSGLGLTGIHDVLEAVYRGQVDRMIVSREFKATARQCRSCSALLIDPDMDICPVCGSDSLFDVDLVEELVERVDRQGGTTDFADPIHTLTDSGSVAALLRFR